MAVSPCIAGESINALWFITAAVCVYAIGYRFYAAWITANVLDGIRNIVAHAPQHLKSQGWLLFEHGYNQAQTAAQLMQTAGFVQVQHAVDLAGVERMTLGMWVDANA